VAERTGTRCWRRRRCCTTRTKPCSAISILPLKEHLGREQIGAVEAPPDRAIGERFGIDPALFKHPAVKAADIDAVYAEALMNGGEFPHDRRWVPVDFMVPTAAVLTGVYLDLHERVSWNVASARIGSQDMKLSSDHPCCCFHLGILKWRRTNFLSARPKSRSVRIRESNLLAPSISPAA
jgi:hypothetical protein